MTQTGVVVGLVTSRRPLFWIGFYVVVLVAWVVLFLMARSSPIAALPGTSSADYWNSLCISAVEANPGVLFAMWALMTAAMMLPSFAPAVHIFADIGKIGASSERSMWALVAGYTLVWLAFSGLSTGAQLTLAYLGSVALDGSSISPQLTAGLFLAAGAYQFSRVKAACLAKCRHPLMFFIERWHPGNLAALRMGVQLGVFCLGCCWLLMLLGFTGGAMNLAWMGTVTLFMIMEKLPGLGRHLTVPAGIGLVAAGGFVFAQTLNLI
jgi:predicted metal-binding membrane protein